MLELLSFSSFWNLEKDLFLAELAISAGRAKALRGGWRD